MCRILVKALAIFVISSGLISEGVVWAEGGASVYDQTTEEAAPSMTMAEVQSQAEHEQYLESKQQAREDLRDNTHNVQMIANSQKRANAPQATGGSTSDNLKQVLQRDNERTQAAAARDFTEAESITQRMGSLGHAYTLHNGDESAPSLFSTPDLDASTEAVLLRAAFDYQMIEPVIEPNISVDATAIEIARDVATALETAQHERPQPPLRSPPSRER